MTSYIIWNWGGYGAGGRGEANHILLHDYFMCHGSWENEQDL